MKVYDYQAGWYFFINDHLCTPQKIVNASGEVVWAGFYQPFGKAWAYPATIVNNFRFPGQYYDAETGLYYNWHRYYDPDTGRYLTPDPIGQEGGINLYAYAENNPINLIDFFGHEPVSEGVIIGGTLGGPPGAAIGAAAGIIAGVAIYVIWDTATKDKCEGKWKCQATCHETPYGGVSRNQRIITAIGGGSTKSDACQNAIKNCRASAAPGTYTRHCQCPKCWR